MKKAVLGLGIIFALSPVAQAMADSNFYVGARVGAALLKDNCAANTNCDDKDAAGGFILGYDFGKMFFLDGLSIEGTYDFLGKYDYHYLDTNNTTTNGKYNIYAGTLAPKFDWAITDRTDLFAKVGAAWWRTNGDKNDFSDASLMAGLGADHRASDMINLRLEYQYIHDINTTIHTANVLDDTKASSHMLAAGITFHFGRAPLVAVVEEAPVIEYEEVVYEEITPVEVEPVVIASESAHINFGFGQTELTTSQKIELDPMVQRLNEYEDATATITGYTDNVGSEEVNLTVSQKRAKGVADYFMQNGISMDRLDVQALGESDPIAPNSSKEGRQENRRVEIQSPEFTIIEESM